MILLVQQTQPVLPWIVTFYTANVTVWITTCIAFTALSATVIGLILSKLKDTYESDHYLQIMKTMRAFDPHISVRGPLKRFSGVSFATMVASAIGVILNVSVGRFQTEAGSWICLASVAVAAVLFVIEIVALGLNLAAFHRIADASAETKLKHI